MPVELRKRKAPAPPPAPAPKKQSKVTKTATKAKEAVKETAKKVASTANGAATKAAAAVTGKPVVGDVISLDGFGGEIETNDGAKTTLKALVDESEAGVVLFTYPKASTPGCTKQACLFRDKYTPLTASGLSIYGLSTDSPKANTTFKEKQKLPYPLLCDPSATLIGAIGLKKAPKGTTRGVFVVDKSGKVLAAEPGSPDGTVGVVTKIVEELKGGSGAGAAPAVTEKDEDGDAKMEDAKEEKEEEVAKEAEAKTDDAPVAAAAPTTEADEKKEEETKKPAEDVAATTAATTTEEKKTEEVNGEVEKKEDKEEETEKEGEKKE